MLTNFVNKKSYFLLITIIFTLFWFITFCLEGKAAATIEAIELIMIALYGLILLVFTGNIFAVIQLIMYIPFVFSKALDARKIPVALIIAGLIIISGMLINFIRNKPKIALGKLFAGLIALSVAMILGGILTKEPYIFKQIVFCILIVGVFLLMYIFFMSSSKEDNFKRVALLMLYLSVMIVLQIGLYFISSGDIINTITSKNIVLGWGISNNAAVVLLLTGPFIAYLAFSESGYKAVMYILLFALIEIMIILTYSRGGIAAGGIVFLPLVIVGFIYTKEKKKLLITSLVAVLILASLILILMLTNREAFNSMIETILKINFDTLNGREQIYEQTIEKFRENPIFGIGMFGGFYTASGEASVYQWAHGTFWQTLESFGMVGIMALLFHLVQKYFYLIKNINFKKFILLIAFIGSGLYGLVDLSYYYFNYMVVIIFIFILTEHSIEKEIIIRR